MSSVRFRKSIEAAVRWLKRQPEGTEALISEKVLDESSCECGLLPRKVHMGWYPWTGSTVTEWEFTVVLRDGKPHHVLCGREIKY